MCVVVVVVVVVLDFAVVVVKTVSLDTGCPVAACGFVHAKSIVVRRLILFSRLHIHILIRILFLILFLIRILISIDWLIENNEGLGVAADYVLECKIIGSHFLNFYFTLL